MNRDWLDKLLQSKKYRDVCPDTVRRVWAACEAKYKKPKDADKAAREALHGITGAFMTPADAAACSDSLRDWVVLERPDALLSEALRRHASTRERLPLRAMDALYGRIFDITGKPGRVLDLACGINPIYLGARGHDVTGVDISAAAVGLVNGFAASCGAPVRAVCADLLCDGGIPDNRYDVALMLKLLPLLERQRSGAAARAMDAVNAAFIVASFPTRTLGGRNVGMAAHYSDWMAAHLPAARSIAATFETENELYFILEESRHESVSTQGSVL